MEFRVTIYKRKKRGNRKDEYTLVIEKRFSDLMREKLINIWLEVQSKEKSRAFLKGMFDAEGSLNFASTRRGREIKITNTDKEIVSLVRFCLSNLEIPSKITITKGFRPNRKVCFNVKTYGKSSIKFIRIVKPYKIFSENYLKGKVHPNYLYLFQ